MEDRVMCSSCGGSDDLHAVTLTIPGGRPGRLLLYCAECRSKDDHHPFDVSIPQELLTEELFVALYRTGRTSSEPDQACAIVFGRRIDSAIRSARAVLER